LPQLPSDFLDENPKAAAAFSPGCFTLLLFYQKIGIIQEKISFLKEPDSDYKEDSRQTAFAITFQ